jgi:hypothetical protein
LVDSPPYFDFTVDRCRFYEISSGKQTIAHFYLALLYCVTCDPLRRDALTNEIGFETALRLLRNARCFSNIPLTKSEARILQNILDFVPKREYYPPHLCNMQVIKWNRLVPPSHLLDDLAFAVKAIVDESQTNVFLFQEAEPLSKTLREKLTQRTWGLHEKAVQGSIPFRRRFYDLKLLQQSPSSPTSALLPFQADCNVDVKDFAFGICMFVRYGLVTKSIQMVRMSSQKPSLSIATCCRDFATLGGAEVEFARPIWSRVKNSWRTLFNKLQCEQTSLSDGLLMLMSCCSHADNTVEEKWFLVQMAFMLVLRCCKRVPENSFRKLNEKLNWMPTSDFSTPLIDMRIIATYWTLNFYTGYSDAIPEALLSEQMNQYRIWERGETLLLDGEFMSKFDDMVHEEVRGFFNSCRNVWDNRKQFWQTLIEATQTIKENIGCNDDGDAVEGNHNRRHVVVDKVGLNVLYANLKSHLKATFANRMMDEERPASNVDHVLLDEVKGNDDDVVAKASDATTRASTLFTATQCPESCQEIRKALQRDIMQSLAEESQRQTSPPCTIETSQSTALADLHATKRELWEAMFVTQVEVLELADVGFLKHPRVMLLQYVDGKHDDDEEDDVDCSAIEQAILAWDEFAWYRRIAQYRRDLNTYEVALQRELANPLSTRKFSLKRAWKVLQLEQNIRIRPGQIAKVNAMLLQDESSDHAHRMDQLFMGEGKTSVLLPMLASTISRSQKKPCRIVVLNSLLNENQNDLRFSLGSGIGVRIFSFPFNRDVSFDTNMSTLRASFAKCQHQCGVWMAAPEHILSLRCKALEFLLLGNPQVQRNLIDAFPFPTILDECDESTLR